MKKLITYLLKTAVGKAIVEILINEFLFWLERQGFKMFRVGGPHRGEAPLQPGSQRDLINKFCRNELEKL